MINNITSSDNKLTSVASFPSFLNLDNHQKHCGLAVNYSPMEISGRKLNDCSIKRNQNLGFYLRWACTRITASLIFPTAQLYVMHVNNVVRIIRKLPEEGFVIYNLD